MIDRDNYRKGIAKNFLCVPFILQTILLYHNIIIDEEKIIKHFKLYVPEGYNELDGKKTNNSNKYGINVSIDTINNFFKTFNLPFHEEFVSIFNYEDWSFDEALNHYLNTNNHIICGYSYGSLYNEPEKLSIGHISLITNKNKSKVQILDPGPRNPGLKYVDSEDLFVAIKRKANGLWLISKE